MESVQILPTPSDLSPSVLSLLDHKFRTIESANEAPDFVLELQNDCFNLDQSLSDLNRRFRDALLAYASFSSQIHSQFSDINAKLNCLRSSTRSHRNLSDGVGGNENGKAEKFLREELPALAKEVAKVETVRVYAETALKLDTLVGDIEDSVSYSMRKHSLVQNRDEMWLLAIKTLKMTEEMLTSISKIHPQWTHLISAVDHRIDRALATLRPQAIADHRTLLASLGWPPPLSSLNMSKLDAKDMMDVPNPLLSMQGDLKLKYCENFFALCNLQELQRQRKSRQLDGHNQFIALHQPLWAIEELVSPISLASQRHFSKWLGKPEFIFALVYKITMAYVDSMDELLQPLVDEAGLVGCSCREEWISAMVTSLSTYLAKDVFPVYVSRLKEESDTGARSHARMSWLNLIDLMISFDKQVKFLIEKSGIFVCFELDAVLQKISSFSIFCDRPDWLDIWAEIELNEAMYKLNSDVVDESKWTKKVDRALVSYGPEDYKSPIVSSSFLRQVASFIERCRSLPSTGLRSKFLRLTGVSIVQKFLDCLLIRCQEAEGLTALTDDDALVKVAISINGAHYFESVLKEWSEDVFFLEMGVGQDDQLELLIDENGHGGNYSERRQMGIFDEEIRKFEAFGTEWVDKISLVILRGFDAHCRDYIKNRRQWQEKVEEGWTVSKSLIGALDYLQRKMSRVELSLNCMNFTGVWRSLAAGIDRLFFNGIVMTNVKFNEGGVERFASDIKIIHGVFGAWCLRPEGFFAKTNESLKLLKMEEKKLQACLTEGERWLIENGIRHLSVGEAEKIFRSRIFTSQRD